MTVNQTYSDFWNPKRRCFSQQKCHCFSAKVTFKVQWAGSKFYTKNFFLKQFLDIILYSRENNIKSSFISLIPIIELKTRALQLHKVSHSLTSLYQEFLKSIDNTYKKKYKEKYVSLISFLQYLGLNKG